MKKLFPVMIIIILLLINYIGHGQKLSIQTGHSSSVLDLKFSPNGKIIASCGTDNKIILWDMISFKQMNILSGHSKPVNSLAFHPSKNIIASASDDKTVILWEYPSGKIIKTFNFFDSEVKSVDFNPDGSELACGSDKIYLIDLEKNEFSNLPNNAKQYYNSLAYSSEKMYLAFGGEKETYTYVYNIEEYPSRLYMKIRNKSNSIIFDENNDYIYLAGENGSIKKISLRENRFKKKFNIMADHSWNSFNDIVLNDRYFIACNNDNLIYMYERESGKQVNCLNAHKSDVNALAVSPDGVFAASAGNDRKILIWNIEKQEISNILQGGANRVNSVSFSEDGKFMFIAYDDGSYRIWNLAKKGKILYGEIPKNFLQKLSDSYEVSTINGLDIINTNRIFIKTYLNKSDRSSSSILNQRENVVEWRIGYDEKPASFGNLKTTDYQSYFMIDTAKIISIRYAATHSQKKSLIKKNPLIDREEVFKTTIEILSIQSGSKDTDKLRYNISKSFTISGDVFYISVSYSGNSLLVLKNTKHGSKVWEIWDVDSGKLLKQQKFENNYDGGGLSSNDKYFYLSASNDQSVFLYRTDNFKIIDTIKGSFPLEFSPNSELLAFSNKKKELILYNIETQSQIFNVPSNHLTDISDIKFNVNYNYIATSGYDGLIKFWDVNSGKLLMNLAAFNKNDFIYVTPEHYYYSTKGAMDYIGFVMNDRLYTFEQFDLKYNRPDIVLSSPEYSNNEEIKAYYRAYLKRLSKMGFSIDIFSDDFNIPNVTINNIDEFNISASKEKIALNISASDSLYKLNRVNIWVNDVPVFGMKGIDIKDNDTKIYNDEIEISLSSGINKIQVSVVNEKGIESLKETFKTVREKVVNPDLYVVAIGVSKYSDPSFNLNYAEKDANDFLATFNEDYEDMYKNIFKISIMDEEATRENILALKNKLLKTNIDDQVIVFYAGHGVLDDDYNYYLTATELSIFDLPETTVEYSEFQNLLDGIPARKKLILIDACHSGEVDQDQDDDVGYVTEENSNSSVKRSVFESTDQLSKQNSFELMKDLFSDLRRGSGAIVISSAGGNEYAFEGQMVIDGKIETISNGVFTYSLIEALQTDKADLNGDNRIQVSELQKYVFQKVQERTLGNQNPTSRQENLEYDFIIK